MRLQPLQARTQIRESEMQSILDTQKFENNSNINKTFLLFIWHQLFIEYD